MLWGKKIDQGKRYEENWRRGGGDFFFNINRFFINNVFIYFN